MPNKTKEHKGVCRLDQKDKNTHGWLVRVFYLGKCHQKFFPDSKHGGKDANLGIALSWRNETEKRIGKVRTDRIMVTVGCTQTGVVGVRLEEKMNRYVITWVTKDGKQGKTSVSIRRHGKTQAFKRACEIRRTKDAERFSLD